MAGRELPTVSGRRVVQALTKAGFLTTRATGSHHLLIYSGDRARAVTVPVHGNRDVKPGTLRSIIRQAGFSVEEFVELL